MNPLNYVEHYPHSLQQQVQRLIDEEKLGLYLLKKYPTTHAISGDKALYAYVIALRSEFLRKSEPLSRVSYDGKISDINDALGDRKSVV